MRKQILLLSFLLLSMVLKSSVFKAVNSIAGSLSATLTHVEMVTVTNITITGTIDARDFVILRDSMPMLVGLNLDNASITAYTGTQGTFSGNVIYSANAIPPSAFRNLTTHTSKILLVDITIPSNLKTICDGAFSGCIGLVSISIPESVNHIMGYVFDGCINLSNILVYVANPQLIQVSSSTFSGLNRSAGWDYCRLYVPASAIGLYKNSAVWKDFTVIGAAPITVNTNVIRAKISVYPNPATDYFQVTGLEGAGTVTLSDLNGRVVFTKYVVENEKVSLRTLPKGTYLMKLENNSGVIKRKIVKK